MSSTRMRLGNFCPEAARSSRVRRAWPVERVDPDRCQGRSDRVGVAERATPKRCEQIALVHPRQRQGNLARLSDLAATRRVVGFYATRCSGGEMLGQPRIQCTDLWIMAGSIRDGLDEAPAFNEHTRQIAKTQAKLGDRIIGLAQPVVDDVIELQTDVVEHCHQQMLTVLEISVERGTRDVSG